VDYKYEVHFLSDAFAMDNNVLKDILDDGQTGKEHKILFVIEDTVAKLYPALPGKIKNYIASCGQDITMTDAPQVISGGEEFKTFQPIENLCHLFANNNLCRHSYVGIIGGGAFLDSVGLAASLVHRGIRQLRFPTTVLSQNDSGVGVKNGVNMFGKKNFAGTFSPPYAVINDFDFLETLGYRDWISGVPEAFKVAMIKDAIFFHWLIDNSAKFAEKNSEVMQELIERCAALHLDHIANNGDPFEFGSARPLDFGHWAAHKLEMMTESDLRHGEAVAIGLVLDSYYAVKTGLIPQEVLDRIITAFREMKIPVYHEKLLDKEESGEYSVIHGLEEFREHLGGELHITLPDGLGKKIEVNTMDYELIIEAIQFLSKL